MLPPEPWLSFLLEIDEFLDVEHTFHCLGGFVVTQLYGSERSTSDVDFLTLVQRNDALMKFAGLGSPLYQKHKVYLDPVGVAIIPDDYADRLTPIYPDCFEKIRLFSMDPYDIILSKLERNSSRDRDDVEYLAQALDLNVTLLKHRYEQEVRYQVKNERREDQTLNLWIEMIEESQAHKGE
ncbi:MAG: hypothetical protein IPI64_05395 [Chloracidobacterium sp.]|nr:hypothetical protein [Chloracidobacterium sp.]